MSLFSSLLLFYLQTYPAEKTVISSWLLFLRQPHHSESRLSAVFQRKKNKKSKKSHFISNTNHSLKPPLRLALRFSVCTVARGSFIHLVITLEVSLEENCFVYDKKCIFFCFKLCSK